MANKVTNAKLKRFRNQINQLLDEELAIRADMKQLYAQLVADAGDEKLALRQIRQAFFQIQKHRINKLLEDRLEFHPFFTAQPFKAVELFEDAEDEEDEDDE